MVPVFALVGRPNVGKSTLFNYLARRERAIVGDRPGVTRDRLYARISFEEQPLIVIDTPGFVDEERGIDPLMREQAEAAIHEADVVLWVLDAKTGITGPDYLLAEVFRALKKPILLIINKADGRDADAVVAEFYELGFKHHVAVSAKQKQGANALWTKALTLVEVSEEETDDPTRFRIAVVGRPNVGKSTFINHCLNEPRVLVFDEAGTTRDSIDIPFDFDGVHYQLTDTAGVRRRTRIHDIIEQSSVLSTLRALRGAQAVIQMCDASEGWVDQDQKIYDLIDDAGHIRFLVFNKSDALSKEALDALRKDLRYRLSFAGQIPKYFVSLKRGWDIAPLFKKIQSCYMAATADYSTHKLTEILREAVERHQPPVSGKYRIKLRFAHQGGQDPLVIVIHGNQTEKLPKSYQRYLLSTFIEALDLPGIPIRIRHKTSENPFAP